MENFNNERNGFNDEMDDPFMEFDLGDFEDEPLWDKLIQQIIDGNVIPVIGPDLLTDAEDNPHKCIMKAIARKVGIKSVPESFSELVYHQDYSKRFKKDTIYYQVPDLLKNVNFKPSQRLQRLLATKQFPFVITTSFMPIVEQTMKGIWNDELKVMRFNNDPSNKDDIKSDTDLRKPTVYYMFGKMGDGAHKYVLTDTDMLDYVSSWLSNGSMEHPRNLCAGLKDKYILMLGNDYNNWLFRFVWYSMRKSNLGHGMIANDTLDEALLHFLDRAETFTKPNTADVIDQIIARLDKKIRENETKFNKPEENMDVFISYSRSDSDVAEKLYEALTSQGKRVWYDKRNLTAGGNFMEEIRKAIRTAKYFVPILSKNLEKEKDDSHVYRNEWDTAIEVAISMGRTYIIPLAEKEFDFYKASLPERLQQHNAIFFSRDNIEDVANEIIHKMNED